MIAYIMGAFSPVSITTLSAPIRLPIPTMKFSSCARSTELRTISSQKTIRW